MSDRGPAVHVSVVSMDGKPADIGWTTYEDGTHVPDGASDLTFEEFSAVNALRCNRWHPGFPEDQTWTLADWSNAAAGEMGEACNVVKKIRRLQTGSAPGPDDPPEAELWSMLADEIADTVTYLDLLATFAGIDLAQAIAAKFNRVSIRQDFPDRLPERTP